LIFFLRDESTADHGNPWQIDSWNCQACRILLHHLGLANQLILEQDAMQVDRVFDALASRPRREILAYLSKTELTTSQIAQRLEISAPAISRHLAVLEAAGLVQSERRGQLVLYRLTPDNLVNTLSGYLFEVCPVAGPLKRASRRIARCRAKP
jgi:DNA-binding transcriptional ArsR family regulator